MKRILALLIISSIVLTQCTKPDDADSAANQSSLLNSKNQEEKINDRELRSFVESVSNYTVHADQLADEIEIYYSYGERGGLVDTIKKDLNYNGFFEKQGSLYAFLYSDEGVRYLIAKCDQNSNGIICVKNAISKNHVRYVKPYTVYLEDAKYYYGLQFSNGVLCEIALVKIP